jgi:hypothetical protein
MPCCPNRTLLSKRATAMWYGLPNAHLVEISSETRRSTSFFCTRKDSVQNIVNIDLYRQWNENVVNIDLLQQSHSRRPPRGPGRCTRGRGSPTTAITMFTRSCHRLLPQRWACPSDSGSAPIAVAGPGPHRPGARPGRRPGRRAARALALASLSGPPTRTSSRTRIQQTG